MVRVASKTLCHCCRQQQPHSRTTTSLIRKRTVERSELSRHTLRRCHAGSSVRPLRSCCRGRTLPVLVGQQRCCSHVMIICAAITKGGQTPRVVLLIGALTSLAIAISTDQQLRALSHIWESLCYRPLQRLSAQLGRCLHLLLQHSAPLGAETMGRNFGGRGWVGGG